MLLSIRTFVFCALVLTALCGASAQALIVTDGGGNSYDVTTITDSYNNISALLMEQAWWGNSSLASALAEDLGTQLGTPNLNDTASPGFARLVDSSFVYAAYFFPDGPTVQTALISPTASFTFAIVNPVPLPPALALFALPLLGLGLRRRGA